MQDNLSGLYDGRSKPFQKVLKEKRLGVMCSIAAVACTNIGDLTKAEAFATTGYDLANAAENDQERALRLSQLAAIEYYRGNVIQALTTVDRAIDLSPHTCKPGYMYKHLMLKTLGRFDEALEVLQKHQNCAEDFNIRRENRFDGTFMLANASLYAAIGDGEKAYSFWQRGAPEFERDVKMRFHCKGLQAWILALLGQNREAISLITETENTEAIAQSPGSLRDNAFFRLQAAFALQEHTLGLRLAQEHLTMQLPPISFPQAYYLLGECRRGRNEDTAARQAYEKAVALGLDTHFTRLAKARLQEMS